MALAVDKIEFEKDSQAFTPLHSLPCSLTVGMVFAVNDFNVLSTSFFDVSVVVVIPKQPLR